MTTCALTAPKFYVYVVSLGYQLLCAIPCAIVAALVSHGAREAGLSKLCFPLCLVLFAAPYIIIDATSSSSWLPDLTADEYQVVRFTFGSLFFICAFRMLELGTGNPPGKAASSRANWVEYLTSSDARRDADGKPLLLEPGMLRARVVSGLTHFVLLGTTLSLLMLSPSLTPLRDALNGAGISQRPLLLAAKAADDISAVVVIWLFLEFIYDVDGLMLELKGVQQVPAFRNPIGGATNIGDLWSRRWNLQVQAMLKRACYLPVAKAGLPRAAAAAAAFAGSAILHELQFSVAFRDKYQLGRASQFFVLQAVLVVAYNSLRGVLPKSVAAWSPRLKNVVTILCLCPTAHLFADIWRETGMFASIASLALTYRCASY